MAITQRPGPGPACEGQALCSGWLSLTQEPEPWARSHRLGTCSFWFGEEKEECQKSRPAQPLLWKGQVNPHPGKVACVCLGPRRSQED